MHEPTSSTQAPSEKDFSLVGVCQYAGVRDRKGIVTSLYEVFERIADPASTLAAMQTRYRALLKARDPKADELKKQLPGVTFSGTFSKREAGALTKHTHLIVADIDHHDSPRDLIIDLSTYPCVLAAFVSPGGAGVKALIAVDKVGDHLKAWESVAAFFLREFRVAIDKSGKDSSRLCFLAHDPAVYVAKNLLARPLEVEGAELETGRYTKPEEMDVLTRLGNILPDVTIVEAQRVLSYISPDCPREQWLNVGLALHVQFDHSDEAADLFAQWSAGELGGLKPTNYDGPEDCLKTWASLKDPAKRSRVATFRSVLRMAYDVGMPTAGPTVAAPPELKQGDKDVRAKFITAIREAPDVQELTGTIAELIANTDMFPGTRNDLAEVMAKRYTDITDKRPKMKDLRDALGFKVVDWVMKDGTPAWAKDWCYVNADRNGMWFNRVNGHSMEPGAFNNTFQSELISPYEKAAGRVVPAITPVNLLIGRQLVPIVSGVRYQPGAPEFFEEPSRPGMLLLNSYHTDSMPTIVLPEDWTEEQSLDVETWKKHFYWMLPEEEAKLLEQFLAYVVRYPLKRVGWAYLIQGPEGIGKSIVGYMMRAIMGQSNVKSVDNATLGYKSFNEWAEGAQLSMIEEVYVDGASKWDVMNTLKPVITNDRIGIHPKGKKPYEIKNVTSYLMFTNHRDPLPLTEGDRRYYIAETRIRERAKFLDALKGDKAATRYFARLAHAADRSAGALLGYLLYLDLKGFDPTKPPTSKAKEQLIMASTSNDELLVRDLILAGKTKNVTTTLVELEALKAALEFKANLPGQTLGRVLRKMGYDSISACAIDPPGGCGEKSRWFAHGGNAIKAGYDIQGKKPYELVKDLQDLAKLPGLPKIG